MTGLAERMHDGGSATHDGRTRTPAVRLSRSPVPETPRAQKTSLSVDCRRRCELTRHVGRSATGTAPRGIRRSRSDRVQA